MFDCLIVLSVKAGAYPGRIFSVRNNWLKLHWAICVEPKIKGCVCSGGVANWVWGAKRSKESHRLGRDMDHRTMFNFHGTQNRKKLWLPNLGNLSQPSPTAQVSVAPVRMEIPSLVCTVHCNTPPIYKDFVQLYSGR